MQRTRRVARARALWLLALASLALVPAPTALAQSGEVRVSVSLPEVLVLGYYPEIRAVVDGPGHFTANSRSSIVASAGEGNVDVAVYANDRFLAAVGGANATAFATGVIPSAIGVRGTSSSGRTSLRVEVEFDAATHPAGGRIVATEVMAVLGETAAPVIDFATPGIGDIVVAGIAMTLDLRGARNGGWHEGIRLRVIAESL